MLNFVERTTDMGTTETPLRKLRKNRGQDVNEMRQHLISRIETAREALFATTNRHPHLSDVRYAAIGVSLHVRAGNSSSVKLCPFSNSSGWLLQGLHLTAASEGTASYLLADVISYLKRGLLDEILDGKRSILGHIESLKGYPEILDWEDEDGKGSILNKMELTSAEPGF